MPVKKPALPSTLNAALLLADGTVFWGSGFGAQGTVYGEICFNTAMTGYQEVMTDPSYAGQIVTFTFPHIGNTGCNAEDVESCELRVASCKHAANTRNPQPATCNPLGASGLIVREPITEPSNFRATSHLGDWLKKRGITGISGIDTRALTRLIRLKGAQNVAIVSGQDSGFRIQVEKAAKKLASWPSLEGMELGKVVSTREPYEWTEPRWSLNPESRILNPSHHVVAIDYGAKLNILRSLASLGCRITVVPAGSSAETILKLKPDGVFLSNGPGDPAATAKYAVPVIRKLVDAGLPVFGICLGHQLLGLAFGAKTEKMHQGHRGVNHPIKNIETGKVEITSQNHGFVVSHTGLPHDLIVTHRSLFDGTIAGLRLKDRPVFCVQYHPESSPGPHDSRYLFEQFVEMMDEKDSGFGIQDSGIGRQGKKL